MNTIKVQMPKGVNRISDFKDFSSYIPEGHIILNKKVTGCGATTYYLSNDTPVILCCHRTQLLENKMENDYLKTVSGISMFYFSRKEDETNTETLEMMKNLKEFLESCNNPFTPKTPKVLVTVDSLSLVIQVLEEMGILEKFTVISDECQCIIKDSVFKGNTTKAYLRLLDKINNVIFLTATPNQSKYYAEVSEFKDITMVELEFSDDVLETYNLREFKVKSIFTKVYQIIDEFKENGYFEKKGDKLSTEACFYLNSVEDILKICKKMSFSKDEVNIICSKSQEKKIKKAGYTIGYCPQPGQPHKTYTFITKAAFEGVDFNSLCAMTYIFSNPNKKSLALDIKTDVFQILGRQRIPENPFRLEAKLFFQTKGENMTEEEFDKKIKEKLEYSEEWKNILENIPNRSLAIVKCNKSQDCFTDDYISYDENSGEFIVNDLVMVAEKIAWENENKQYNSVIQVLRATKGEDVKEDIKDIEDFFLETKDFGKRLKFYCDYLEEYPYLKGLVEKSLYIEPRFSKIYNELGVEKIKTTSFREDRINSLMTQAFSADKVAEKVYKEFKVSESYTKKEIKDKLQIIYNILEIDRKAKANFIELYFETQRARITIDGKRVEGYKLIKIK